MLRKEQQHANFSRTEGLFVNISHSHSDSHGSEEEAGSIGLWGGVAMGTGVMIGAGIFALTGQIAELAGPLFPLSFIASLIINLKVCAKSAPLL